MRTGAQLNHFLINRPLSHFYCLLLFTATVVILIVIAVVVVLGRTSASCTSFTCPLAVVVAICILNFMNTGTVGEKNGNERRKLVWTHSHDTIFFQPGSTYHSSMLQSLNPLANGLLAIFKLVIYDQIAVLLLLCFCISLSYPLLS